MDLNVCLCICAMVCLGLVRQICCMLPCGREIRCLANLIWTLVWLPWHINASYQSLFDFPRTQIANFYELNRSQIIWKQDTSVNCFMLILLAINNSFLFAVWLCVVCHPLTKSSLSFHIPRRPFHCVAGAHKYKWILSHFIHFAQ